MCSPEWHEAKRSHTGSGGAPGNPEWKQSLLLWPGHRVFRPEEYERGFLVPTGDNTLAMKEDLARDIPASSSIRVSSSTNGMVRRSAISCPMVVFPAPRDPQRDPLPTTGFPFRKSVEWLIECGGHLEQSRHADISLSGFQGREETWAHPGLLGKLPDAPLFCLPALPDLLPQVM